MSRQSPFQILIKPTSAICNLNCRYCFYLGKEELFPGSPLRMSDRTLELLTRQYLESQATPEVIFAWQGGEPTLMGLDFYRKALAYQETYRRPGTRVQNSIQTNGVNLDREWAEFFRANHFLVGVSLDGPKEMHDAYRVDKGGRPTFARVIEGIRWLQESGVDYNILTCLHRRNVAHPVDVYRFLHETVGAHHIQFIPIVAVERAPNGGNRRALEYTVSGQQYGDFLTSVFYDWVHRDVGRVYVQLFDVALAAWLGTMPGLCVFAETCGQAVAVEHTGDVYSCDHFVEPAHHLGNIHDAPLPELALGKAQNRFGRAKRARLPEACRACTVRFVCQGGCPKDRIAPRSEGQGGLNWLCAGYHSFFTYIDPAMKAMSAFVRAGRPAAEIMSWLESARLVLPQPEMSPSKTRKHRRPPRAGP